MAITQTKKHVRSANSLQRRRQAEKRGRLAELIAALLLTCKGYRILGRRVKTPFGELDLIACRGNRIAFVEVKYRTEFISGGGPVARKQSSRIAKAAEHWLWRQRQFRNIKMGLDCILISRSGWPRHIPDVLQPLT